MRLTKPMAAAAALSMVASPVIAAPANPAAKLSLAGHVASSNMESEAPSDTSHRSNTWLIGGIVVVAIIVLAVAMGGGGDKDSDPASA